MNFEYMVQIKKQESIDIENIGNCALDVYNDLGFNWVLIVKTVEGMTEIIEYGPTIPDIDKLPSNVSYTYSRFEFKEYRIIKTIDAFLNGAGKGITQAFEIEVEEAKNKMKNLVDYTYVNK